MDLFKTITNGVNFNHLEKPRRVWSVRINLRYYHTTDFEEAYKFSQMFDANMISYPYVGPDKKLTLI